MQRRNVLLALVSLLPVLQAARARGQSATGRQARVGFLAPVAATDTSAVMQGVLAGLSDFGYIDGKTASFEFRYASHALERLPALAAELVAANPDVIHTFTTPGARAAATATATIPIVVAPVAEPTIAQLAGDMAHPTGNITGFTLLSRGQEEKCLELLKEAAPQAERVAVLRNPLNPAWRDYPDVLSNAARSLKLTLVGIDAESGANIGAALNTLTEQRADALFVLDDTTFVDSKPVLDRIVTFARDRRLPSISTYQEFARVGGLLSLGTDIAALTRGAADYIHRILGGAKPHELPVVRPQEFKLVANEQTARALGITLPPALLGRSEVIK
jgi:putative tryptophan/tyrosine transport system substrate-binding protein